MEQKPYDRPKVPLPLDAPAVLREQRGRGGQRAPGRAEKLLQSEFTRRVRGDFNQKSWSIIFPHLLFGDFETR